jgi:hypothetical protein
MNIGGWLLILVSCTFILALILLMLNNSNAGVRVYNAKEHLKLEARLKYNIYQLRDILEIHMYDKGVLGKLYSKINNIIVEYSGVDVDKVSKVIRYWSIHRLFVCNKEEIDRMFDRLKVDVKKYKGE